MSAFWMIPKEWVTDWGLSCNEAILLADIISWPTCSDTERARRTGMDRSTVYRLDERLRKHDKCLPILEQKDDKKCCKMQQKVLQNATDSDSQSVANCNIECGKMQQKVLQNATPPTPPYIEEQEKQEEHNSPPIVGELSAQTKKFKRPTVEEVRSYCIERNNGINPEAFVAYYDSCGWTVGRNKPMKNWKGAIRTWEQQERRFSNGNRNGYIDPARREVHYTGEQSTDPNDF